MLTTQIIYPRPLLPLLVSLEYTYIHCDVSAELSWILRFQWRLKHCPSYPTAWQRSHPASRSSCAPTRPIPHIPLRHRACSSQSFTRIATPPERRTQYRKRSEQSPLVSFVDTRVQLLLETSFNRDRVFRIRIETQYDPQVI